MSTTATLAPATVPATSLPVATCDRCGAAGQNRYVLPSGLDLVLCGHHSRTYGVELFASGAAIELVTR